MKKNVIAERILYSRRLLERKRLAAHIVRMKILQKSYPVKKAS